MYTAALTNDCSKVSFICIYLVCIFHTTESSFLVSHEIHAVERSDLKRISQALGHCSVTCASESDANLRVNRITCILQMRPLLFYINHRF
jgi:hypothetical protein